VIRRKPLKAKKGLTQKTPLKTKTELTTRKTLQPRSKKMREIYRERIPFVAQFLLQNPKCGVYWDNNCFEWAADVHEIKPRSAGGKIVGDDPSNYMAVCRYCHDMIGRHPEEAHRRGFRKWSWED